MSRNALSDGDREPVERKVQFAGNSTFVVSLPKEWALEQDLESGMSMYLYPHDDRIVAATGTVATRERDVIIDASAGEAAAVRRLRLAYTTGCDRITVTGLAETEPRVRRTLERAVARLIGITIRDDADDRLLVTNLLDSSEVSLSQTIAQVRQLALELHADAVEAVVTGDADLARRVVDRDDDVDRLFAFVSRGFHRGLENVHEVDRLGTDRMTAFREYRVARQLERIADQAEEIATVATRQSGPPEDAIADRLEAVGGDARRVVERSLADDPDSAYEAIDGVREGVARLERALSDRPESDPLYGTVARRLERTAENGLNIADARLGASLER